MPAGGGQPERTNGRPDESDGSPGRSIARMCQDYADRLIRIIPKGQVFGGYLLTLELRGPLFHEGGHALTKIIGLKKR